MKEGIVVAVCLSQTGGVPKYPQDQVTVGPFGIDGDYHAGEYRINSRGEREPNRRAVTVVAAEAIEAVCQALGVSIPYGGVGENVLVRGLGDLSDISEGQRLRFSSGVELEVTGQNTPCANLSVYHPQTPKQMYGRRGLLAVVIAGGELRPGDRVTAG